MSKGKRFTEEFKLEAVKQVAVRGFFEHVLARLKAGEDLTRELAAFKKVDTKEAIKAVHQLIKACKDDLKLGYWDIKSKKIRIKVRTELISGDFEYINVISPPE